MSTLVVCVDREGTIATATGTTGAIIGREAVRDLVTEVGLNDPESSRVNCLLKALRVVRDLEEESVVAVVTGADAGRPTTVSSAGASAVPPATGSGEIDADRDKRETGPGDDADGADPPVPIADHTAGAERGNKRNGVDPDRAIARQIDRLVARYEPEAAIIVLDSAADERLVPVIESRVRVDAVDRVVVRQARDIESTYYLIKQFLADEELRRTVLIPIGLALLGFPVLFALTDRLATALAAIAGVTGAFLLYEGLGIDDRLGRLASQGRTALYSGQVSIVTYVVAVGLALVGVFAGAIGSSGLPGESGEPLLSALSFAFEGVPWFTSAALVASTGRLLDEVIGPEGVRDASFNLPFGVVAVGLVIRGFTAYFLERAGAIGSIAVPPVSVGAVSVQGFSIAAGGRLAAFVVCGVLVSLLGVGLAARNTDGPDRLLD